MNLCAPSLNTRPSNMCSDGRESSYYLNEFVAPKAACSLHDMPTGSLASMSAYGEGLKLVDRRPAPFGQPTLEGSLRGRLSPGTIDHGHPGEMLAAAQHPVSPCNYTSFSWLSNADRVTDMIVSRSVDRMDFCRIQPGVGLKDPFHHNRRQYLATPVQPETRSTASSVDSPSQHPARSSSANSLVSAPTLDSPKDMVVEYKIEDEAEIVSPITSPPMSYKKLDHRRNAFRESSLMRRRSSPGIRRRMANRRDKDAILARMRKSLAGTLSAKKGGMSLRSTRTATSTPESPSDACDTTSSAIVMIPSDAAKVTEAQGTEAAANTTVATKPSSSPSSGAAVHGTPPTEIRRFAPSQA